MGVSKSKKCTRTSSLERAYKAIILPSKRPMEQCVYFLETLHGYHRKGQKYKKLQILL